MGDVRTTPRPPLTKRLRPVHWTVIDYCAGAFLGLIIFATIRSSVGYHVRAISAVPVQVQVISASPGTLITLAVSAGATISVATRRKRPMTSLCLLLGGSVLVAVLTGGQLAALCLFAPAVYVLYLIVASFDNRRAVGHALAGVFLTMVIDAAIMIPHNGGTILHGGGFIPVIFAVVTAWSLGYIVRQRRRYTIGMQEEAASKAVAVERLRIARELHDVVAHSMSVIAVQAGYGQYVIDGQPADAKEALGAIAATSREALEEMRRMLGALRQADEAGPSGTGLGAAEPAAPAGLADLFSTAARPGISQAGPLRDRQAPAPLFPAPGLTDLDALFARTARAGVRAQFQRAGTPRDLPGTIELSAYRIIQEALTNVVKHARASTCSVLLDYGQDELRIEITDSGAGVPELALAVAGGGGAAAGLPSGGHGIIGMRERVSLLGGEFTAGPLPGYGFQVNARLPVPRAGA